jgi:multisubunit Na+/H+ antiporter MnhG subunit
MPIVYLKGFFIIVFVYLTAPLAAHSIVKSFKDKEKGKSTFFRNNEKQK